MERITRSNAVETASQWRSLAMKQEDCDADDYFAIARGGALPIAITVKLPEMNLLVYNFHAAYSFLCLGLQFLSPFFRNYVSAILKTREQVPRDSVISVGTC
jgi:hypothetical protein